jgi:hypothetical protein
LAGCALAAWLAGCGGGSGEGRRPGNVAGIVTDVDGQAVAGARVTYGSLQTTSVSNGSFVLEGVPDGYRTLTARITIQGRVWSGATVVDVSPDTQNRNINLIVSDEAYQGSVAGSVFDAVGRPVAGAKVFVVGPKGPWGSTMAVTDRSGDYRIDRLPSGLTYVLTASAPDHVNDSKQVTVETGKVAAASFALGTGSGGLLEAPTNLVAQSWTVPDTVTRSDTRAQAVYDWLKARYRRLRGWADRPAAKNVTRKGPTRSTPLGSFVEIDLFWDYKTFSDLWGYDIQRGVSQDSLRDVALARDPYAASFFDLDYSLTPDVVYYYAVARLDTVQFPLNGAVGPSSNVAFAQPFSPMTSTAPSQGALAAANPTFAWNAVPGAAAYEVYVWDRFPDLQNSSDPDGVTPLWPDAAGSDANVVDAPATSIRYNGPALVSGHTYYWLVVARDAHARANTATFSASPIRRFTVR